jgi:hypothetical protein
LIEKSASRQNSNILRIPPGGTAQIDTGGRPIQEIVMPLPYHEAGPGLMALLQEMSTTGMRIGGTAEQMVGEGKQDAQTGAVLAIIEQQTVVKDSVHKRMHAAQCEEFKLLFKCFREHPESFWQQNRKPANQWDEKTFLQALDDYDLVPQADPNTASQTQRVLKYMGLAALAEKQPTLFDPIAINTAIITDVLKIANPQQFFAPPAAMGRPTPDQQDKASQAQQRLSDSKVKLMQAQSQAEKTKAEIMTMHSKEQRENHLAGLAGAQGEPGKTPHDMTMDQIDAQARMLDAQTNAKKIDLQRGDILLRDAQAQEDRKSKEKMAVIDLAKDVLNKRADMQIQQSEHQDAMHMDMHKHNTQLAAQQQQHESGLAADQQKHQSAIEADMKTNEMGLKSKENVAKMAAKKAAMKPAKPSAKPQ